MLRRRAVRAPAGVRLESGEKLLALAEGPDETVAATTRRLIVSHGPAWPWHQVERASWDGDDETLTVYPLPESSGGGRRRQVIHLTAPGRLVDVVREQVNGSLVIDRYVPIDERRGVRVTGRRTPDGGLTWNARLDSGLQLEDPDTKRRINDAVASVRREVEW